MAARPSLPERLQPADTPDAVVDLLGRRWALRVLREAWQGPVGFREIRRRLAELSTSVLSQRLSELGEAGLLHRGTDGYTATADAAHALRGLLPFGDDRAAQAFAVAWTRAWNVRDLASVLRPYRDDVVFRSPATRMFAGPAVIEGKAELEAYWSSALAAVREVEFTLERALWDGARRELVVLYLKRVDGTRLRATEFFRFDEGGRIYEGEAMFGVPA